MAVDIVMPRLSDSMEEGTVLQWFVAEGAPVWESFSGITLPRRRRKAARDFARAAAEVELVIAAWAGHP